MKNFLNISETSSKELREILEEAKRRKKMRKGLGKISVDEDKPMEGKSMIMIFEKPSTRTRISFDLAVKQLGGSNIILSPDGIHYGKGNESLKDTAKVLSEYSDIIMIRTSNHKNLNEFASYSKVPLINGLSEKSHPCQILSDILTFEEIKGEIKGKTLAWLGDGNNNMSNSFIEAAAKLQFKLKIGSPKKYSPNKDIVNWANKHGASIEIFSDPKIIFNSCPCVSHLINLTENFSRDLSKKI